MKNFLKQLEPILDNLEALSQHPDWEKCCQLALDDGEMTLGDALQAIGWLIEQGDKL